MSLTHILRSEYIIFARVSPYKQDYNLSASISASLSTSKISEIKNCKKHTTHEEHFHASVIVKNMYIVLFSYLEEPGGAATSVSINYP